MKRVIVAIVVLGLQGCFLANAGLKKRMDSYLGQPLTLFIEKNGVPDREKRIDVHKSVHEYIRCSGSTAPTVGYSAGCSHTLLTTTDGVITAWRVF